MPPLDRCDMSGRRLENVATSPRTKGHEPLVKVGSQRGLISSMTHVVCVIEYSIVGLIGQESKWLQAKLIKSGHPNQLLPSQSQSQSCNITYPYLWVYLILKLYNSHFAIKKPQERVATAAATFGPSHEKHL